MGASIGLIDIFLLLLFIPALIKGFKKGFMRQLAGLIGLILGIWAACHFSDLFIEKVNIWSDTNAHLVKILAFVFIFAGVLILTYLLGRFAEGLIQMVLLGWLDKILGILFAIINTAIFISIFIYILNSLDALWSFLPKKDLAESSLFTLIEKLAPAIFPYLKELHGFTLHI